MDLGLPFLCAKKKNKENKHHPYFESLRPLDPGMARAEFEVAVRSRTSC